jgi:hypothetical protein
LPTGFNQGTDASKSERAFNGSVHIGRVAAMLANSRIEKEAVVERTRYGLPIQCRIAKL